MERAGAVLAGSPNSSLVSANSSKAGVDPSSARPYDRAVQQVCFVEDGRLQKLKIRPPEPFRLEFDAQAGAIVESHPDCQIVNYLERDDPHNRTSLALAMQ